MQCLPVPLSLCQTLSKQPMKKLCLILALLHAALCQAQTFIFPEDESIFTEYNDGRLWAYRETDGCVVGLTCFEELDDYGRFYQIHVFVKNIGNQSFIFWPDSISADIKTKRENIQTLPVYTHEEFQKKMQRTQTLVMALYGISAGLNAGMAGHSTSYSTTYSPYGYPYTTITHHYDANAAYQANLAATNQILTLGEMMENDREIRKEGYLKTTTIYPDEAIVGHMNIRYKKGRVLTIHIPINGRTYSFSWDVSKKKRSK